MIVKSKTSIDTLHTSVVHHCHTRSGYGSITLLIIKYKVFFNRILFLLFCQESSFF